MHSTATLIHFQVNQPSLVYCRYCIKAKSKPSTVNDNIDMTDFYNDDYGDYEDDDEEEEEEAGDDTDDSGNGES